jgi:hypothetical protein
MAEREEKKLVYVSKSLVDKAANLARKKGVALSKLVEDSIELTLSLSELGYDAGEALEVLKSFKALKVLGGAYLPIHVLERARSLWREGDSLKAWYECGRTYGLYIREKSTEPLKTLKAFLEVMRWDVGEVSVEAIGGQGGRYRLRYVCNNLSEEETAAVLEFVKGLVEGLGARLLSVEAARGLLLVDFEYQAPGKPV